MSSEIELNPSSTNITDAQARGASQSLGLFDITARDILDRVNNVAAVKDVMASPPTITAETSVPAALTQEFESTLEGTSDVYRVSNAFGRKANAWGYRFPSTSLTTSPGNVNNNQNSSGAILDFYTDAPQIAIEGQSGTDAWFEVNGEYAKSADTTLGDTHPNSAFWLLDFGASKVRRIKFRARHFTHTFNSIFVEPEYSVWRPAWKPFRMQFFSDSMGLGTADQTNKSIMWPSVFADICGVDDFCISAIGGTGFLADGTEWRYESHISDIATYGPNMLVMQGSVNDSTASQSALEDATQSCLEAAREQAPDALIVVTGAFGAKTSNDETRDEYYKNAYDAWADPNSLWLPSINAAEGPHFFGTGEVGATAGDGNMDRYNQDGTHLNEAGYAYGAQRMAIEFVKAATAAGFMS